MTVTLCVCGVRFVTTLETLGSKPGTKLANVCTEDEKEYFFDRNPEFFTSVLDYYRTGDLHMPKNACRNAFRNELEFWDIDGEANMSVCCLEQFTGGRLEDEYKNYFDTLHSGAGRVHVFPSTGFRETVYHLFEDPFSSKYLAKIPAGFYILCVLTIFLTVVIDLSVAASEWRAHTAQYDNGTLLTDSIGSVASFGPDLMFLQIVHFLCVCYIFVDFFIRLLCCPTSKRVFLTSPFNVLDYVMFPFLLAGILDSFVSVTTVSLSVIEFLSVFQILLIIRLLKFFRDHMSVKVLYLTLKSSFAEMALYLFLLVFCIVFFGCFVLVCEFQDPNDHEHGVFLSVFRGMWFAIVTFTLVGYGDFIPVTTTGKLVSGCCAVTGIVFMAFVFSVIHNNFNRYFAYGKHHMYRKKQILSRGVRDPRDIEGVMLIQGSHDAETDS